MNDTGTYKILPETISQFAFKNADGDEVYVGDEVTVPNFDTYKVRLVPEGYRNNSFVTVNFNHQPVILTRKV